MIKRQHRCPYYLLKIQINEIDKYLSKKKLEDKILNQINFCTQKIKEYQSIIQQIYNLIKQMVKFNEPKPLLKCVEEALISPLTKNNTLSLVK